MTAPRGSHATISAGPCAGWADLGEVQESWWLKGQQISWVWGDLLFKQIVGQLFIFACGDGLSNAQLLSPVSPYFTWDPSAASRCSAQFGLGEISWEWSLKILEAPEFPHLFRHLSKTKMPKMATAMAIAAFLTHLLPAAAVFCLKLDIPKWPFLLRKIACCKDIGMGFQGFDPEIFSGPRVFVTALCLRCAYHLMLGLNDAGWAPRQMGFIYAIYGVPKKGESSYSLPSIFTVIHFSIFLETTRALDPWIPANVWLRQGSALLPHQSQDRSQLPAVQGAADQIPCWPEKKALEMMRSWIHLDEIH